MKYLWTGHMCAFAAFGVCGKEVWTLYLRVLHCNTKTAVRYWDLWSHTHCKWYWDIYTPAFKRLHFCYAHQGCKYL